MEPCGCVPHRDDPEVDVLGLQWVGAGALQDGKVLVVLLHRLVDAPHGFYGLHPAGDHHGTSCQGGTSGTSHFVTEETHFFTSVVTRNSLLLSILQHKNT